jgi:hypothetical protein
VGAVVSFDPWLREAREHRRPLRRASDRHFAPETTCRVPQRVGLAVVTPHDDLFHFTFRHVRHVVPWLRCLLPKPVRAAVDWRSLQQAPEKLRGVPLRLSIADLVFRGAHGSDCSPVWFVIEHKALGDGSAEHQLLRYAVHLGDLGRRTATADVVALLLHHGARPFVAVEPAPDDPFAPFQPRLPLVVDDLTRVSEADLLARDLTPLGTLTLLCLRALGRCSGEQALQAFERWGDLLRRVDRDVDPPLGRDAIAKIASYALTVVEVAPRELHETFERLLERPEDTIMGTLEHTYQKGRAEGRLEGRAEGRAETILLQLAKRFGPLPPDVPQRVRAGTDAELERWADRLLDARSLPDVFAR